MRQGSLRLRLLAAGAASIVLALAIAGFGLLLLFERHVERRMAAELRLASRQLVSGLDRAADGTLDVGARPAEPRFLEPLSGLYWQIAAEPERTPCCGRARSGTRLLTCRPTRLAGRARSTSTRSPVRAVPRCWRSSARITLPASLGGGTVRAAVALDRAEIHAAGRGFRLPILCPPSRFSPPS